MRRWLTLGLGALLCAAAGAGATWAGIKVLAPPADPTSASHFTFAEVVEGEVGSSLSLTTFAEWALEPAGASQAVGVVTGVAVEAGDQVKAGDVLYTVNLRPVVVAEGSVPAFRTLASGSRGADVAQLEELLKAQGHLSSGADQVFDWYTAAAVRSWQRSLGLTPDGVVQPGDIVFVPTLPTRVSLDTELVKRGSTLAGGEEVISSLPSEPVFFVLASEQQASMMSTGTRVEITGPQGQPWVGIVSGQEMDEFDNLTLTLSPEEGAESICGADCGSIPVTGASSLASRVVTVPTVEGLRVPSAALLSTSEGNIVVVDDEGEEHEVSVVASARGMSIVEGITAGMRVRVPASEE